MTAPDPATKATSTSVECLACGGDGYQDPRQTCPTCGHGARVVEACIECNGTGRSGEPRG